MSVDSQISSGKESGCEEMAPSKSFWLKKKKFGSLKSDSDSDIYWVPTGSWAMCGVPLT